MDNENAKDRRSQMRWAIGTCVVLLLIVLLLYVAQRVRIHSARNALNSLVQKYRERGDPTVADDLNHPPVGAAENGTTDLLAAANQISDDSADWKAFDLDETFSLPLSDEQSATLRRMIEAAGNADSLVQAAQKKSRIDWGVKFRSPLLITVDSKYLLQMRRLARFERAAALLAAQEGRFSDAIQNVRRIRFIARAVWENSDTVSMLVGIGIDAMTCSVVIDISPDLKIDNVDVRAATPGEVQSVISELLDETPLRKAAHEAIVTERLKIDDSCEAIIDGRFASNGMAPIGFSGWLRSPALLDDARRTMETLTMILEKSEASPSWPRFEQSVPQLMTDRPGVFSLILPAQRRTVFQTYNSSSDRRLAATVLALRLFASRHDGALPNTLAELVPAELDAVPLDPLSSDDSPIRYRADPPLPIVYSVGLNGRDDNGTEPDPEASRKENEEKSDEVRHLKRRPKPIPTTRDGLPPELPPWLKAPTR